MTEKGAKQILRDYRVVTGGFIDLREAIDIAIQALEEIQQYRAIGTTEDIQLIFSLCKDLERMVKKYESIGTIDEFKSLKEKNEPKKPIEETDNDGYVEYYCPNCEAHLFFDEDQKFCNECGQAIDCQ